jgi:UDP-N-acetyl-D-glucosamine dehydrogenase
MESTPLTGQNLAAVDAVILVTDHSEVDYELILEQSPLIIDTRGKFRHEEGKVYPA